MRKAAGALLLLVAGLAIYNYFTSGTFSPLPSASTTGDERKVRDLEEELQSARQRFRQAGRGAGIVGVETTSDAEAARLALQEVERGVANLKRSQTLSGQAARRLERLEGEIVAFKGEMGG